jgi:hypothetical protein
MSSDDFGHPDDAIQPTIIWCHHHLSTLHQSIFLFTMSMFSSLTGGGTSTEALQAETSNQAVQGFSFPTGHLGHLSPSQQESFEQFKTLCRERGKYTPAQGDALPSHEDQTLL